MKEDIRKEILYDLQKAVEILQIREEKDVEELQRLSDHAIDDIAVQKDLELVSISVLFYSVYKIISKFSEDDYQEVLDKLQSAERYLQRDDLGKYNQSIKALFEIVRKCNVKVREHLQDVMQAARIKKGTALLQRGLSIGQAAGIMGLSNWDLQHYAGKTMALSGHEEKIPAGRRVRIALRLFGVGR